VWGERLWGGKSTTRGGNNVFFAVQNGEAVETWGIYEAGSKIGSGVTRGCGKKSRKRRGGGRGDLITGYQKEGNGRKGT